MSEIPDTPGITEPSTRVALAMPTYGEAWGWASRAFYARATQDARVRIAPLECETSLLANSFNGMWCRALNMAESGPKITHFAMLHSDVAPEDWWLDTLLAELETHKADILSVVIPIKDQRGLTSTGLDDPANRFRPEFRLTMKELANLPETFGAQDLGYPERALLVNTGCWVCKFDLAWATQHAFTINDRIVKGPLGWTAQVEPEDWEFSRWAHRQGLKVMATKKVEVLHRGVALYSNRGSWGKLETDPLRDKTNG